MDGERATSFTLGNRPVDEYAPGPELSAITHEAYVRGFLAGMMAASGLILFVGSLLAKWVAGCP
jgi:threonine/homoserine/homoserine lactone efflux protein